MAFLKLSFWHEKITAFLWSLIRKSKWKIPGLWDTCTPPSLACLLILCAFSLHPCLVKSLLYRTLRPQMTFSSDLASCPSLTKIIQFRECTCSPLLSTSTTYTPLPSLCHFQSSSYLYCQWMNRWLSGRQVRVQVRRIQQECGDISSPVPDYVCPKDYLPHASVSQILWIASTGLCHL